ncbi:MAG: hypothetical protein SR1Q7_12805 [Quinella sp. 1Q7]|nr:hypothetical protein [Quinella sp. 1Q7]
MQLAADICRGKRHVCTLGSAAACGSLNIAADICRFKRHVCTLGRCRLRMAAGGASSKRLNLI